MTDIPPKAPAPGEGRDGPDPADTGDDRHDPAQAAEIASRHDAHSPEADPIIPGRPRASLGPWLWISALVALLAVLIIAGLAVRL